MTSTLPDRTDTDSVETREAQPVVAGDSMSQSPGGRRSRWMTKGVLFGTLVIVGGTFMIFAAWTLAKEFRKSDRLLVFYTVTRSDLPVTVVESGNLESQVNTKITCDVETVGYDRSGATGSQILFIVPNGEFVKEGDLLVELDAAPLQDRLDSQVLATERAKSEQIQAEARYKNQEIQNQTTLAKAQLDIELAELAVKQYGDEESGTFQIDLQDVDLAIQEARAKELIQATDLNGIEILKKLGYRSKGDLEQARLNSLAAGRSFAKALASRRELTEYTQEKIELQLDGALDTAIQGLKQVENNSQAEMAQAEARKNAADRALEKETEMLEKYGEQLDKCKIYAPHDGMATYAVSSSRYSRSSSSTIAEGATVRQRQEIITLPDLSTMQVKTAVHESVLDRINPGLRASITIDAFPDARYKGSVKSVAVLPDQGGWMSSDIKVYETVVTIDEKVERLKPGMTAVVEIHVERLKDVLSVPVQAIVQIEDQSWCYVGIKSGVERRILKLGTTNDEFVEIREGISEGDRVVLNPMSVVDEGQEREAAISPDGGSEDPGDAADEPKADDSSETEASEPAQPDAQRRPPSEERSAESGRRESGNGQRQRGGPVDLMQYDKDGDGKVSVDGELPEQMQRFAGRMDADNDGFITAQEVSAMRSASPGGSRQGRGMGAERDRPGGPSGAPGGPSRTPGGPSRTPGGPSRTPGGPSRAPGGDNSP